VERNAKLNEVSSALAKAVTHHLAGQSENALSDLDIAVGAAAGRPKSSRPGLYLQLELGRFDEAWKSYSKALELTPGDPRSVQRRHRTAESWPRAGSHSAFSTRSVVEFGLAGSENFHRRLYTTPEELFGSDQDLR